MNPSLMMYFIFKVWSSRNLKTSTLCPLQITAGFICSTVTHDEQDLWTNGTDVSSVLWEGILTRGHRKCMAALVSNSNNIQVGPLVAAQERNGVTDARNHIGDGGSQGRPESLPVVRSLPMKPWTTWGPQPSWDCLRSMCGLGEQTLHDQLCLSFKWLLL